VEGNDKCWARTKVLAKLVELLSSGLGYEPADPLRGQGQKKNVKLIPAKKVKPGS
jgi:hypothetical protein